MEEKRNEIFEAAMAAVSKDWSTGPVEGKEEVMVSTQYIVEQVEEVMETNRDDVSAWMQSHGYELTWNKELQNLDWIVYETVYE